MTNLDQRAREALAGVFALWEDQWTDADVIPLALTAIRNAIRAENERCAGVADNPGFIEARDTEWDVGVNYAKRYIATAIRRTLEDE